jgi:hypothetical protein
MEKLARQLGRAIYNKEGRAISAVVAQQLYTLWVGGSNPSSPTIYLAAAAAA